MTRPLRIEYPGAWYHAMNRGASYRNIFSEKVDYDQFIIVLKESCNLFNTFISSYCLMPNHYHLLIHTPEGNLSRVMRHINGVYTQRYNKKHKKDGPLFRGRYKAILVQEEEYLTGVVKYIHNNPLKAGLVKNIKDFTWSSHSIYLKGKSKEKWLSIDPALMTFSDRRRRAVDYYKEFMEEKIGDEINKFYSKKNQGSILGEESFIKWIKENYIYPDNKPDIEIREKKRIQGEVMIEKINFGVCAFFGIEETELFLSKRGKENIPRLFAILLSKELSGLFLSEIGKFYKMISYRTVGSNSYRFNERVKRNKKISKQFNKLKSLCSQTRT